MTDTNVSVEVKKAEPATMQWFRYHQNNSGGRFTANEDVTYNVFIQAPDANAANSKAQDVGIYFDGCANGWDCDCCGDRWSEAYSPMDSFTYYSWKSKEINCADVESYAMATAQNDSWAKPGEPAAILYYANGDKATIRKS